MLPFRVTRTLACGFCLDEGVKGEGAAAVFDARIERTDIDGGGGVSDGARFVGTRVGRRPAASAAARSEDAAAASTSALVGLIDSPIARWRWRASTSLS